MSRTVITLVAIGAVVIAAAVGVSWRARLNDQASLDRAAQPAAAAPSQAQQAAAPPAATATRPPAAAATPAPAATPPTSPATELKPSQGGSPPPLGAPTFDVARIGADGRAVIAGRGAPGAKIVLLDGGKEIARSEADSRGEWVIIAQEPPLSVGQHELRVLQHIEGRAPVTSEQVVIAVVPAPPAAGSSGPKEDTLVMMVPPAGATKLLQAPSAAGVPKSGDLGVSTIDYDERGKITISGQAAPGTIVRAYVDDKLMAEGAASSDGTWRLTPTDLVETGKHQLRVDRLARDGKPVARLELPFNRSAASGSADTRRLIVVRGDNLWNIARAHYGAGHHHTVIYGANQDQIRNPDLIYPGQVFTLPKVN